MGNEVEKFDPAKMMEGVKDRIKATFVSLIPDDMWEQMVEREIYVFTTGKIVQHHDFQRYDENGVPVYLDWEERIPYEENEKRNSYGGLEKAAELSPLRQMIRDELTKKFAEDIRAFLDGDDYKEHYVAHGKTQVAKAVEEILVNNSDKIFRNMVASMIQYGVGELRSQVQAAMSTGDMSFVR